MRYLMLAMLLVFVSGCKGFQSGAQDVTQSTCDLVTQICEMVPKAIGGDEPDSTPTPEPDPTEEAPE